MAFGPLFSHRKYFFVGWNWFYIGNRLQETQPNQIVRKHPIGRLIVGRCVGSSVDLIVWLVEGVLVDRLIGRLIWLAVWTVDSLIDGLVGWLSDWLSDWVIDWLIDWLVAWLVRWLLNCLIAWLIDWCYYSPVPVTQRFGSLARICTPRILWPQTEFTKMLAGFFGGEGFVLQRLTGKGDAFVKAR